MAANEKEFTLIGRFDDQITKKLKAISDELNKLNKPLGRDNVTKSLNDGFAAANKELKTLQDQLKEVNKFKMQFDKSGIQAAVEEVKVLGKEINNVSKAGFQFDKSGIVAAQHEANVLGDILKANALIKVGEGFSNALMAGATSAVSILQRGMGFMGQRFSEAVQDQLGDVMARGSLFGSLSKEGMFKQSLSGKEGQALKDASNDMYLQTKNISRSMDNAINDIIRTSTVSSETIQTLSRQLGDNLLPVMLREKGITDLSVISREKLNEVMGGEQGVGKKLATLYSQIGSVIPNPSYAPQAAMGITKFLGAGTIDRQLAIFEQNPVLVDALREGLKKFGNTVEGRIKAASYGFSIAMPEAALEEAKNTIAGGMQSVHDTFLGPSGILTLTADINKQGDQTLKIMTDTGARQKQIDKYDRRNKEVLESLEKEGKSRQEIEKVEQQQINNRKRFIKNLDDFYQSADSPIEVLATQFGPLLQSFADMVNSAGNLFIGPVNKIVTTLARPLGELQDNLENLGSDIRSGKKSLAEALGRALAQTFRALANYFSPEKAGQEVGGEINKFFSDFAKGFKNSKIDGQKYLKIVLDSLQSIIMKLIFKEGNALKGFTVLGDALSKVFLLLAAPAFISALISGLVPIALTSMGGLLVNVSKGLALRTAGGAAASAAGGVGAGAAGVATSGAAVALGLTATIALVMAAFVVFEGPLRALANWMQEMGSELTASTNWAMAAAGLFLKGLGDILKGLTDFFTGIWDVLVGMLTGDTVKIQRGIRKIFVGIYDTIVGAAESIAGLGGVIVGAIGNLFNAIGDWIQKQIPGNSKAAPSQGRTTSDWGTGGTKQSKNPKAVNPYSSGAFGSESMFTGNLGAALNFEMKNKPAGSHLVIANSSETIIPAAGGLGARELANTMKTGLDDIRIGINESNSIHSTNGKNFTEGLYKVSLMVIDNQKQTDRVGEALAKSQQATANSFAQVQEQINRNQSQTGQMFMSLSNQVSKISLMGGMAGGGDLGMGAGGLGLAASMARTMGLVITSTTGGRHAPGSYHYAGRAIDVGGSSGAMLAYAQRLASSSGGRMAELFYTPLGFSIKNGVRVPWTIPNHMDHVHVAYALGGGNPALFSKQSDAVAWERKMVPSSLRVKSVTTNSGETSFGPATIHAPITIYQQPHQDAEQLASMVAIRIGMAVDELRNHA